LNSSTDSDLVLVGRLGRPHGLKGFLVLFPESDNDARFDPGSRLLMASGDELTVRETMAIPTGRAIAFAGFDDRTVVEHLRGAEVFVEAGARRRLDTDEYWPDELVGLTVRDRSGTTLGVVESVDDTSAQTRVTVLTHSGRYQVPLVRDLIPVISVPNGYLVVADLPGLLSED
jgi:16S rRNA processing protein RimM